MTHEKPFLIKKELVPSLSFPSEGLPMERQQQINLAFMLETAVKLGNSYKEEIRIMFRDDIGLKMVETSVWQASQKHIVLKGGIIIPFNRVESVQLQ
ncbi:MAG TPA: hypothetical protein DHU89_03945 [Flavobacteriales bacterium]|nr:hypothetical protein [Flavobacteriales bacterium]|tara:strand:+ start:5686 stop:5976 length:291 start_codon:yes stop_codon:yes gene_type:complete